ncbi:HAMP domain-containing sensor histidine kinase [Methylobrevis albus]|uniref:histidine kinase n=1 Tax=Methylobrevis albus TaxID=2793297 RepID=A0A931I135_9HYPH|nr:HAMP domain-containing sensor histidine kinase [Methylobrevis albus]MBH0238382.1 HAMP domain-containing histidine kinase [Methylobrevis albus]
MKRLFWKFFFIIWLTMATSIGVLFAASAMLQITPHTRDVERARQDFALDTAAGLLAHAGRDAALAFVAEAARGDVPIDLSVSPIEPFEACSAGTSDDERTIAAGDACFRITLHHDAPSLAVTIWPMIAPGLSVLLAAAAAAYWLARYLIRPVAHLRGGLAALASGRFDVRIGDRMDGRKDEVAALAHDFDASATRLAELQRTQQRLFHDVSHELRSPLSRLQAAIGVLQQNPARLGGMMDRMVREVERIDGLVGEILTLARLTDRSQDGPDVQTLDVIDLLNDIVTDAAFEAQARKIRVVHEGTASFVADVNGELIYRALENVIRNAVKYTADGSDVSVRSLIEDDALHILVADQGPGVAASELDQIFQPFSRGENAGTGSGYGLGLAIAKQAVEWHGGRVAASAAASGGLVVSISIPSLARGSRPGSRPTTPASHRSGPVA